MNHSKAAEAIAAALDAQNLKERDATLAARAIAKMLSKYREHPEHELKALLVEFEALLDDS